MGKNEANRDKREPRLEIGMDGALKKENPLIQYGRKGLSIGPKIYRASRKTVPVRS